MVDGGVGMGGEFPDDIDDLEDLFDEVEFEAKELVTYIATIHYKDKPDEEVMYHELESNGILLKFSKFDEIVKAEGMLGGAGAHAEFVTTKMVNVQAIKDIDVEIAERHTVHPEDQEFDVGDADEDEVTEE